MYERPLFPSYSEMPQRVPPAIWHLLRVSTVVVALGLVGLLLAQPQIGLVLLWGLVIPLLPAVFFVAPGLWRNVCPLAAVNQAPRLLGFTRGLTTPAWFREYAYVFGIALFVAIVTARLVLFNENGVASALLILGVLGAAFVGGLVFKGKSGWCSSICPLLPVQRIYGQTPIIPVRNSHCNPCVGCTKNCYDFNPAVAYLADLYDENPKYSGYRKFFAGAFPGLILAYFTAPAIATSSIIDVYSHFAVFILISAGSFYALDAFLRVTTNQITALYAATALNLFYWFSLDILARTIGELFAVSPPEWLLWSARALVLMVSIVWVVRTYWKEPRFIQRAMAAAPVRVALPAALARHGAAESGEPEVTFVPEGPRAVARAGATLLDVTESNGLLIEAGCRMGMCGSDPVTVVEGMENLSPVGDAERATLERLGLGRNGRMACCAQVYGPVSVTLTVERGESADPPTLIYGKYDAEVRAIVIIGNGVAGITAADHIRRRHPTCAIHVIGRETHQFYNRMAISRLIYGRSAMEGLYLLPDSWYPARNIDCWLNTRATRIDCTARQVTLGTSEQITYDRLILATGSSSFVPPIDGMGLAGSFVLRDADDAMQIRAFVQEHECRTAVVAGGGLLGLEAGYALHKLGLRVSVLERGDRLLSRQLDAAASALLQSYLDGLGIDIVLRSEARAVAGAQRVERVDLRSGESMQTDLLLVCAGNAPNVQLARDAGLEVNRGVVVDDALRASRPDVFAIGDVAEHQGQIYGLWPAAVAQGEVAAVNATGGERRYEGFVPTTMLKVAGIDLSTIGRPEPESPDEIVIALDDDQGHRYRKLVIAQGRIVGAILLGYPVEARAISELAQQQVDVSPYLPALRVGDWSQIGSAAGRTARAS